MAAPSGNAASSATVTKASWTNSPSLMSGIHLLQIGHVLERLHADAAIGVEEALAVPAQLQIGIHDALDRRADVVRCKARTHDVADAGIFRARAAKLELVVFDAFLVDAKDADVAGVMVAAGIDAAADLDLQLADIVLTIEILETPRDVLRDGNGARIGQIAIIEAGTGD